MCVKQEIGFLKPHFSILLGKVGRFMELQQDPYASQIAVSWL